MAEQSWVPNYKGEKCGSQCCQKPCGSSCFMLLLLTIKGKETVELVTADTQLTIRDIEGFYDNPPPHSQMKQSRQAVIEETSLKM